MLTNVEGLNSDYSVSASRKLMQKPSLRHIHDVKFSSAQRSVAESRQPSDQIPCSSLKGLEKGIAVFPEGEEEELEWDTLKHLTV